MPKNGGGILVIKYKDKSFDKIIAVEIYRKIISKL